MTSIIGQIIYMYINNIGYVVLYLCTNNSSFICASIAKTNADGKQTFYCYSKQLNCTLRGTLGKR